MTESFKTEKEEVVMMKIYIQEKGVKSFLVDVKENKAKENVTIKDLNLNIREGLPLMSGKDGA